MSENPEQPEMNAGESSPGSEGSKAGSNDDEDQDTGENEKTSQDKAAQGPEARITALENERNETRDRMLRIAAEFDNYKKRIRREQSDNENKARESVLKDMLEVADNLERASAAVEGAPDIKALQQGVALVLRLFQSKLERYDVKPLDAKGQPFDPRLHDAISQVPTADAPPGSVLSEVQKGYKIGDRLLRPAMVVVAVAPSPAAPAANGSGADGSDQG
jgi:molecular chaperone GrpE